MPGAVNSCANARRYAQSAGLPVGPELNDPPVGAPAAAAAAAEATVQQASVSPTARAATWRARCLQLRASNDPGTADACAQARTFARQAGVEVTDDLYAELLATGDAPVAAATGGPQSGAGPASLTTSPETTTAAKSKGVGIAIGAAVLLIGGIGAFAISRKKTSRNGKGARR